MHKYQEYKREMRVRGRRMYWQHKAKQAGQVVAIVAGTVLFIAVLYGFMLVFPD